MDRRRDIRVQKENSRWPYLFVVVHRRNTLQCLPFFILHYCVLSLASEHVRTVNVNERFQAPSNGIISCIHPYVDAMAE
jgi:hypothetical protein